MEEEEARSGCEDTEGSYLTHLFGMVVCTLCFIIIIIMLYNSMLCLVRPCVTVIHMRTSKIACQHSCHDYTHVQIDLCPFNYAMEKLTAKLSTPFL